jgi:hypothetical protein
MENVCRLVHFPTISIPPATDVCRVLVPARNAVTAVTVFHAYPRLFSPQPIHASPPAPPPIMGTTCCVDLAAIPA